MESGVTAAVGLNATNSWSYASGAYGAASGSAASDAKAQAANPDTSARNSSERLTQSWFARVLNAGPACRDICFLKHTVFENVGLHRQS